MANKVVVEHGTDSFPKTATFEDKPDSKYQVKFRDDWVTLYDLSIPDQQDQVVAVWPANLVRSVYYYDVEDDRDDPGNKGW